MFERWKAAKYLGMRKREGPGIREDGSLRKWSSQGRSNLTREMEGRLSRSGSGTVAQGSSNGVSRMEDPRYWKGEWHSDQS